MTKYLRGAYTDCIRDGYTDMDLRQVLRERLSQFPSSRIAIGGIVKRIFKFKDRPNKSYHVWVLRLAEDEYRFYRKRSEAAGMRMLYSDL